MVGLGVLGRFRRRLGLVRVQLITRLFFAGRGVWFSALRDHFLRGKGSSRVKAGVRQTTRPYHLYVLRPEGKKSVVINGLEFVKYSEQYLDVRGGGKYSKAKAILDFLRENRDRAFFSKEIAEALKDKGVKARDAMANVRRFERKGLVYVRGYKTEEKQTPFKEGYLITWLDPNKPRQQAIQEAIQRTDKVLADRASSSPFMERFTE